MSYWNCLFNTSQARRSVAASSDHSSLPYVHPELCGDSATSPTATKETMKLLAPVLPVAQIVRLSIQTQPGLPEDTEHCWPLQMLTVGSPICSRLIQTLKPGFSVAKEQIQVLHLPGLISSGRIWPGTRGTNP